MNRYTDRQAAGQRDRRVDGQIGGQKTEGQPDGRTDGQTTERHTGGI